MNTLACYALISTWVVLFEEIIMGIYNTVFIYIHEGRCICVGYI